MGTRFRYIADVALKTADDACTRCGTTTGPRYPYWGEVTGDPHDSIEHVLCTDCLQSNAVARLAWEADGLRAIAEKFSTRPASLVETQRVLPHVFTMNGQADWPICCDDWCEFTGHPADRDEARDIPKSHQEWNNGPYGTEFNAVYELLPELVSDVLLFECLGCDNKFHMHNPT